MTRCRVVQQQTLRCCGELHAVNICRAHRGNRGAAQHPRRLVATLHTVEIVLSGYLQQPVTTIERAQKMTMTRAVQPNRAGSVTWAAPALVAKEPMRSPAIQQRIYVRALTATRNLFRIQTHGYKDTPSGWRAV